MDRIDAHVHLYPPEIGANPAGWAAAAGEEHWSALCARRRKDGTPVQTFPPVDELLREMDAAGIRRAVLLGWYWNRAESATMQNRFFLECIDRHPDRLSAFATLHPGDARRAAEEICWAKDHGFTGLGELSPHSISLPVDAPAWDEIFALAGALRMPVNLHAADPLARSYRGAIATPRTYFVEAARRHPQTTFVLAHWGGGLAFEESPRGLANVWFDTAASPLMYGPEVWRRAAEGAGLERVIFGSDFPLRLYPRAEAGSGWGNFVREGESALKSAEVSAVFRENVRRLLRLH
ncbi:MAG TPA: amidohydrolase family protein [Candidatus Didemnitutus sp.]|nr:amidohydrolase family protein [Candidatus Didemnitutus sp.]